MKKLKKNQLGHWCQFCEPKTTRATHVGRGFEGFSCEEHKEELRVLERESADDGHMSEGDYQAWGHL
jgi:predicted metal-dependent hydrolase